MIAKLGRVHLEAGKPAALKVDYSPNESGKPVARTRLVEGTISSRKPEAVAAAKNADVVIAVVGITSELEGEEMQVKHARLQRRRPHQHRSAQARGGSA